MQDLVRTICHGLMQSLIVRDEAGVIVEWNSEAQRLHGWSEAEARGHNADQLLKSRHSLPLELADRALHHSGRWDGDVFRTTKNGHAISLSVVWIRACVGANHFLIELGQKQDAGETSHYNGSTRSPEGSMREASYIRSASNATLSELLSSMAHEANQPLAALSASAQTIRRWLDRPEPDLSEVRLLADQIAGDAHRVSEIIASSRRSSKRPIGEMETLSANETVLDAIQIVRGDVLEEGIELSVSLPSDLPPFRGHRREMQQVIANLIVNSIQAMTATAPSQRSIRISTMLHPPSQVQVIVEDMGPGVSADIRDILFNGVRTADGAIGVGLPVCRSILETHGGTIELQESRLGARFRILLPAIELSNGAAQEA